jgi:signal transduction histidine kinase
MTNYILEESKRINGLISAFLDFARPKEPKLVSCDLGEILEKTFLLLSPQAKTLGVEIRKEIPQKSLQVFIDPDQMRQAFTNLGVNALEAMPQGGVLKVTALEDPKGGILLRFSDTGKGIPKEAQTKVFDPFFTTKEGGTGLGLSIVHRIITQHGGNISVEEKQGGGSIFTISLPPGKRS